MASQSTTARASPRNTAGARRPLTTRSPDGAQLRLADLAGRVVAVDPRTGTTTADLWASENRLEFEEVHDVDDWLAVITTGQCVGVTTESTPSQYGRRSVVFRRLRDAAPVPVRVVWWRADPHPATRDVVGLLAELYRRTRPGTSR